MNKKNFLRATILALVTIPVLYWSMSLHTKEDSTLKVALNISTSIDDLDTKSIIESADYSVLELLLSPLVEYNNQGEIIGGIAERFYWNNNDLIFEFRNTTFSSGSIVTPEDAIATFKRLMILNSNSHGELANLLCIKSRPKTLSDECEGLIAEGNRLILRAKKKTPFLLPLLTSIDYGILNKRLIDEKSLKILSFSDTSGPYKLKQVDDKKYLYANKNHWHYKTNMPQKIEFVPFDYDTNSKKSAENLFIEGLVDFIPTASEFRLNNVDYLRKRTDKPFRVHITNPIAFAYAEYTLPGLALPIEARRHIFSCMRRAVKKHLANDPSGRIATLQILPPSSEGNLSLEQTEHIESEVEKYNNPCDEIGIRIAVPDFLLDYYKKILDAEHNNFTLIGYPDVAIFGNRTDKDVPELTILGVDVSAVESINSISYAVKNGILVPPGHQTPAEWLKIYFDTQEKSDRMAMLQSIQFNTVWGDPRIIPFSIRPFASVINARWETNFSQLFANDPYWKIKLK
ncbi:hypothetical protein EBU99_10755 [bacterium]|nr:hypothetical protein [bacterium]